MKEFSRHFVIIEIRVIHFWPYIIIIIIMVQFSRRKKFTNFSWFNNEIRQIFFTLFHSLIDTRVWCWIERQKFHSLKFHSCFQSSWSSNIHTHIEKIACNFWHIFFCSTLQYLVQYAKLIFRDNIQCKQKKKNKKMALKKGFRSKKKPKKESEKTNFFFLVSLRIAVWSIGKNGMFCYADDCFRCDIQSSMSNQW